MKNPIKWLLSNEAEEGYIPNRELLTYGIGLCGQTGNGYFIQQWFFYFCTDVLHVTPGVVGLITGVSRIWDGINDPIVGAVVDGRRCKSGSKFHTYLARLPFAVAIVACLLFCDFGLSANVTVVIMLALYLCWDLLYSFQEVSVWGTLALMSPHSKERSRATQWLYIGSNGGYALVALVPLVMGFRETLGMSEKTEFFIFGLFYGLLCEMLSLLTVKGKERVAYEPEENPSILKSFAAVKQNKMLLKLMLAQLLGVLSLTVPQIYFFKYMVSYNVMGHELNGETVLFIYNLLVATPGTLGMFFTNKAAEKLGGMKNVLLAGQTANALLRLIAFFVGYKTFPQIIVVMLLMTVAGIPSMMVGIATRSLICDSIDYAEWKTGKRTEAISFSLQSLVTKIASALGNLIGGAVLEWLKYDSKATGITGQSPAFYKYTWPLFMAGPIMGAILYMLPLFGIHYSEEEKRRVEDDLRERHKGLESDDELTV